MKRIKLKFHYLLAALIFLVGVVPVWMSTNIISDHFKQSRITEYREEAVYRLDGLTSYLTENDYLSSDYSDPVVNSTVKTLGRLYSGRILIVRNDFKIVADSADEAFGRYMTMPGAIKCLSDKRAQSFYLTDNRYFIALPVFEKPENGAAIQESDTLISTQPVEGVAVMMFPFDKIETVIAGYTDNRDIINLLWLLLMAALAPFLSWLLMQPFDRMYRDFLRVSKGDYSEGEPFPLHYQETDEIAEVLDSTVRKLAAVDKARGEFVQNVSHELKTPLTSVKILADSLKSMEGAPLEMYQEFIADISTEIDRENQIIDDLLALVKMERTEQTQLNIDKVNVNQMLESILKRVVPIAKQNSIDVTLESRREVLADLDEMKMALALTNIVENAVKYNYSGGWVHVTLDATHRNCVITVSDSGAGIPKENIGQIFERFYRVDKARSREVGGTGLGLAITKGIIDLHHGEIRVESSSEEDVVKLEGANQEVLENADVSVTGTVFTITLPLKYIRPQEQEKKAKRGKLHRLNVTGMLLALLLLLSVSGCTREAAPVSCDNPYEEIVPQDGAYEEGSLVVYRPSMLLTALVPYGYVPESKEVLAELLAELARDPADNRSVAPLPEEVGLLGYTLEEGNLALSLSENYLSMRADREILSREAIVKTVLQLPEVTSVSFYIGENPMAEMDGTPMAPYTEESFFDK